MAVLSRQKQPIADSSLSRAINAKPSHSFNKLQFYQCQAQWPFYQSRSNQMARPLDFSRKLQFRYYPAQSTYQRPGNNPTQKLYQRQSQLLLTNGNFVTGRPSCQRPTAIRHFSNGRFSKRRPSCQRQMAVLSKPMAILSKPMAVLSSRGAPGARLSRQNQSKRQMPRLKAPMAVLSRPGPMAV